MTDKKIIIQQIGSPIRRPKSQNAILKGLGLGKINRIVELKDTESIRGMITKIPHLVKVL